MPRNVTAREKFGAHYRRFLRAHVRGNKNYERLLRLGPPRFNGNYLDVYGLFAIVQRYGGRAGVHVRSEPSWKTVSSEFLKDEPIVVADPATSVRLHYARFLAEFERWAAEQQLVFDEADESERETGEERREKHAVDVTQMKRSVAVTEAPGVMRLLQAAEMLC